MSPRRPNPSSQSYRDNYDAIFRKGKDVSYQQAEAICPRCNTKVVAAIPTENPNTLYSHSELLERCEKAEAKCKAMEAVVSAAKAFHLGTGCDHSDTDEIMCCGTCLASFDKALADYERGEK